MHLTPREQERLLLSSAAELARRRLARGARLGATEAIALVCAAVGGLVGERVRVRDEVVVDDSGAPTRRRSVPTPLLTAARGGRLPREAPSP